MLEGPGSTVGRGGSATIWDLQGEEALWNVPRWPCRGFSYECYAGAFSPDGRRVALCYANGTVVIIEAESGEPVLEFETMLM